LPIQERLLGSEHPATLTARANLAIHIGKAGDAAGARDQYGALLPIREWVSGPGHPATLAIPPATPRPLGRNGRPAAHRRED
jgi:hypothetical protein